MCECGKREAIGEIKWTDDTWQPVCPPCYEFVVSVTEGIAALWYEGADALG